LSVPKEWAKRWFNGNLDVDGWIVVGAFAVQAAFTSWPSHLFLALALLIYAIDVLAPPLYAQVRGLRAAARHADRDTLA
jgi:hypothetical protein